MTVTWSATLWLNDISTEDHSDLGKRFLILQYRLEKPRIQGFLDAFLEQVQNLDDVAFEVLTGIWPLTAIGVQLDLLGEIVGEKRGTLTDSEYRVVILAQIRSNRSKGKIGDIFDIINVVNPTGTIQIRQSHPAGLCISVAGIDYGNVLGPIVAEGMPGGVYLHWSWATQDDADCFAMGDTLGADESGQTDGGFGDLTGATQTTGGYFVGGFVL